MCLNPHEEMVVSRVLWRAETHESPAKFELSIKLDFSIVVESVVRFILFFHLKLLVLCDLSIDFELHGDFDMTLFLFRNVVFVRTDRPRSALPEKPHDPNTFEYFHRLPAEIRHYILELAITSRVVTISASPGSFTADTYHSYPAGGFIESINILAPSLGGIDLYMFDVYGGTAKQKEDFRRLVAPHYKIMHVQGPQGPLSFLFNPEIDTLVLEVQRPWPSEEEDDDIATIFNPGARQQICVAALVASISPASRALVRKLGLAHVQHKTTIRFENLEELVWIGGKANMFQEWRYDDQDSEYSSSENEFTAESDFDLEWTRNWEDRGVAEDIRSFPFPRSLRVLTWLPISSLKRPDWVYASVAPGYGNNIIRGGDVARWEWELPSQAFRGVWPHSIYRMDSPAYKDFQSHMIKAGVEVLEPPVFKVGWLSEPDELEMDGEEAGVVEDPVIENGWPSPPYDLGTVGERSGAFVDWPFKVGWLLEPKELEMTEEAGVVEDPLFVDECLFDPDERSGAFVDWPFKVWWLPEPEQLEMTKEEAGVVEDPLFVDESLFNSDERDWVVEELSSEDDWNIDLKVG